jgi:hypothetical protein
MVGGDSEMIPHQPLNTVVGHGTGVVPGVFGSSVNYIGVLGSSVDSVGVNGKSSTNIGVYGSSSSGTGINGNSISGTAVVGYSLLGVGLDGYSGSSQPAIRANPGSSAGIALEITEGSIKAIGAGIGSNTFAFIRQSAITNTASNFTRIDNVLTNGDQDAMLFVTHVNNPKSISSNSFTPTLGVYYDVGALRWTIYREDNAPFPPDVTFNVMVIKR